MPHPPLFPDRRVLRRAGLSSVESVPVRHQLVANRVRFGLVGVLHGDRPRRMSDS